MRVVRWLLAHWYVPLIFLAAVAGFLVSRKRGSPLQTTKVELEAIRAGADARRVEAELGAEQARRHVEKAHMEALMRLDEEQAKQAAELRDDPIALAKFLVRAGHRNG
jgi:hypothetical protein